MQLTATVDQLSVHTAPTLAMMYEQLANSHLSIADVFLSTWAEREGLPTSESQKHRKIHVGRDFHSVQH